MKKIIAALSLVFFLYVILSGCDDCTDKAKMVHKAMCHVSNKLEKQYQLRYIGMIEGGDKQYYKKIGIKQEFFCKFNKNLRPNSYMLRFKNFHQNLISCIVILPEQSSRALFLTQLTAIKL